MPSLRAAVFDFGGVMTEPIFRSSRELPPELAGLARFFVRDILTVYGEPTGEHDIHLLETARISEEEFFVRLCRRYAEAGGPELLWTVARDAVFREGLTAAGAMVDVVRDVRAAGYRTALLTNNAREWEGWWRALVPLDELFDVVVDSSRVGLRKPDAAIFRLTCEQLGMAPEECLFVDDLACNTQAAEALGMQTVHCVDPVAAAAEVRALLLTGGVPVAVRS